MFPSKKAMPIIKIEEEVAFAEIRITCPYNNTNNVEGCYRMMEYDRRLMKEIGGEFIVLESQAEMDVEFCRIAITKNDNDRKELIPAHIRMNSEK